MDYKGIVNIIRGLVRPLISLGVVAVFCLITYKIALLFVTEQIALMVLGAFIALVSTLGAFWFASRNQQPPR